MTNLLIVLPDFDPKPFSHILPSLEKALVSTADLLTVEALDIAKRASVPSAEVRKLIDALLASITHHDGNVHNSIDQISFRNGNEIVDETRAISVLDDEVDATLNGGIHPGYLTEITGESAVGKTQFLLTLLLSVQLPAPHGLQKSALYISTEAQLQTKRLAQILKEHPKLAGLPDEDRPSLSRIQSTHIHDLEAQEHILRYQVPVVIKRHDIGLVIIDSIAANYRAEFERGKSRNGAVSFAKRSLQVAQLGAHLRQLTRTYNIAVVVANQVADRFEQHGNTFPGLSQSTQRSRPASPVHINVAPVSLSPPVPSLVSKSALTLSTDDPLALDHQQRFFTGWGDDSEVTSLKTPSLGLTWTNQLATRIALLKSPIYEDRLYDPGEDRVLCGWKRSLKVAFSAWCASESKTFEIWQGGIRSIGHSTSDTDRQAP